MAFKNHRSKPDKNFNEVIRCLKDRCGGYWKDKQYPHHYAHLKGLDVCAYDTNKMGDGFPDIIISVSWMTLFFEVKQERPPTTEQGTKGRHTEIMTDDEYYRAQLEDSEVFFRLHHSSIVPIVWDRNQVYEWLNAMADFVLYCEGQAEGSDELLALFFPKAYQNRIAEKISSSGWSYKSGMPWSDNKTAVCKCKPPDPFDDNPNRCCKCGDLIYEPGT